MALSFYGANHPLTTIVLVSLHNHQFMVNFSFMGAYDEGKYPLILSYSLFSMDDAA